MLTSRRIHDFGRPEGDRVEELMLDPIGEIRQERERARETGDPLTDVCYLVTVASTDRAEARALFQPRARGRDRPLP